jgi:nucleoside triphosphate pyrophosphatase
MKLILASKSPRRAEILRNAGFKFEIVAAEVDETRRDAETAEDYVRRLAVDKTMAAREIISAGSSEKSTVIVGADTTVAVGEEILGKPSSADEAREMLRRLSGRSHEVYTGLAILSLASQTPRVAVERTRVTFDAMTPEEIEEYIRSGEPFDKAGAYAIQGRGGRFISRIEGCYFNVMGLPLARLYAMLREIPSF